MDQQTWLTATTPVELYAEGLHRVTYHAPDASGRLEATHTLTVAIDLTPPQLQAHLPSEVMYGDMPLTGLYTVTDSLSNIVTMTVRLNGQPYQPAQPLHLGENSVGISAVNSAGLSAKRLQIILVTGGRLYLPVIRSK
jgi:hypothetical protein